MRFAHNKHTALNNIVLGVEAQVVGAVGTVVLVILIDDEFMATTCYHPGFAVKHIVLDTEIC